MPNSNYFIDIRRCFVHEDELEKMRARIMDILNADGYLGYDHRQKSGIRNLVVRGFDNRYQCTIITGEDELLPQTIDKLMRLPGMYSCLLYTSRCV